MMCLWPTYPGHVSPETPQMFLSTHCSTAGTIALLSLWREDERDHSDRDEKEFAENRDAFPGSFSERLGMV